MGHPDGRTSPGPSFVRRGEGRVSDGVHRRGSVLVLVMTLLSILFVIGVAFLATMNFEADLIAAEKLRAKSQAGTDAVTGAMAQALVNGFMANSEVPFGDESAGSSVTGFAALPGWHDTTSPIEPNEQGVDPVTGNPVVVFPWVTDPQAMSKTPFAGPTFLGASINTEWMDGEAQVVQTLAHLCRGGINSGAPCVNDAGCPPGPATSQGTCSPEVARLCVDSGTYDGTPCVDDAGCRAPGSPAGSETCSGGRCVGGTNAGGNCDPTLPADCPSGACRPPSVEYTRVCPAGVNEGLPCYSDENCGCADLRNCPAEERCFVCIGGAKDGESCDPIIPGYCPDGDCGQPITPVDADGDGVVDSIQVNAKTMGFSPSQLAEISSAVNPPTKKNGKVFIALRIVPHGGMVNLNDAHPKLIETVLHVPSLGDPNTSAYGNFYHRPTKAALFEAYSPATEEPGLRRRGLLPPRKISPSRLIGNGFLAQAALIARPNADGDMPQQLLPYSLKSPRGFESVVEGKHRFWPFLPHPDKRGNNLLAFEESIPGDLDSPPLWRSRMEPFTANAVAERSSRLTVPIADYDYLEYDKRHLVTTISHDDLLSRGGSVYTPTGKKDIREAMIEANWTEPLACSTGVYLPFEYADYPTDIKNGTKPDLDGTKILCECPNSTACEFDRRKGRLQLSLPWLDHAFNSARPLPDNLILVEQRNRIIYDAFMMLLNNASGPAWDGKCRTSGSGGTFGGDCLPWESCEPLGVGDQGTCVDRILNQPHRLAMISRTAASLTANMIDYMDVDTIPTRIALRSFDFSEGATCVGGSHPGVPCPNGNVDCLDLTPGGTNHGVCTFATAECFGGPNAGMLCPSGNVDCPDGRCITPTAGRDINISTTGTPRNVYVYGLEPQPFITEVAVSTDNTGNALDARAIEIFNPTNTAIPLSGYSLVEVDPASLARPRFHQLSGGLAPQAFTVVRTDPGNELVPLAGTDGPPLLPPNDLQFNSGWIIYLVRQLNNAYPTSPGATTFVPTDVVVDQFLVAGSTLGMLAATPAPNDFITLERTARAAAPWTAPVPNVVERVQVLQTGGPPTLGIFNTSGDPKTHNVELFFASTGTFTEPVNPSTGDYRTAFPTTGSMLLLPRHANRSLDDLGPTTLKGLAFTPWLDRSYSAFTGENSTGQLIVGADGPAGTGILEREQIDNGRMPIFDIGTKVVATGGGATFYSAHHVPARTTADDKSTSGRPGEVANLPWGQLVFDYFTALPLRNPGPYRSDDLGLKGLPDSQPRVDLGGLRVHGRIDLNSAPWTVMRGLPLMSLARFPGGDPLVDGIREKLQSALTPEYYDVNVPGPVSAVITNLEAGILFDERAQGIAAYREAREAVPVAVSGGLPVTGDYSTPLAGRSWSDIDPAFRRGMGFLTVGELANVRFDDGSGAVPPANFLYRIDRGVVKRDITGTGYAASAHNFLDAAATLIALGDWVTVRSQVSTVYGVIRGEEDETIVDTDPKKQSRLRRQDLQSRSLRFQETLDRLPTFLGAQRPARIGERVIGKYQDFQND